LWKVDQSINVKIVFLRFYKNNKKRVFLTSLFSSSFCKIKKHWTFSYTFEVNTSCHFLFNYILKKQQIINQVHSLISTGCFCTVYNIINGKILDIETHVQHFTIISDTSISIFFLLNLFFFFFYKTRFLTFFIYRINIFTIYRSNNLVA